MAFTPISNTVPQYEENGIAASGFYIKFYEAGTTTPTAMATDSTGGTLLDKCELDTEGYPINGSSAAFIPHIDRRYKIALFRNATDADNNNLNDAAWSVDNMKPVLTEGSGEIATVADLRGVEPTQDGQQISLLGYTLPGLGGGVLYFDASDASTADDGVAVFVTTSGARWKRVNPSEVSLFDAGAVGGSDDSEAWDRFIIFLSSNDSSGIIDNGTYNVPTASAVALPGDLKIKGLGEPVIDGKSTADNNLLQLVDSSIFLDGIHFKNFTDLVTAGDGSGGSLPNSLTGNIDTISITNCSFLDCRRPLFMVVSRTSFQLESLILSNNKINGNTSATQVGWCGFYAAWSNLVSVSVNNNNIKNIDATAAGLSGSTPANVGNGRAILVGGTFVVDSLYTWNGWDISDNHISNVTDSRDIADGINPEVGAIRVTGSRNATICRNRIFLIKSTGNVTDDCEAIYSQTSGSVISNNTLRNTGENGGAIVIKGLNRLGEGQTPSTPRPDGFSGVCANNVIVNDGSFTSSGIAVYSSDWIVSDNYIEGCGGMTTRYAPIWTNAQSNPHTKILNNTILNSPGKYGILVSSYGEGISVKGNTIDGVLASLSGSDSNTYGILINNTDGNGFNTGLIPLSSLDISENYIGRVVTLTAKTSIMIGIDAGDSGINSLKLLSNVITSSIDNGIAFTGGASTQVNISSNNIVLATDKFATSGGATLTELSASSNEGWLVGEVSANPSPLGAGLTIVVTTTTITDAVSRDFLKVSTSTRLQNLMVWAGHTATPGEIEIYLFNPTTASVDLSTTTFRIEAEKFDDVI